MHLRLLCRKFLSYRDGGYIPDSPQGSETYCSMSCLIYALEQNVIERLLVFVLPITGTSVTNQTDWWSLSFLKFESKVIPFLLKLVIR